MSQGIRFLYQFHVGSPDVNNPGSNVLSVTSEAAGDHGKEYLCSNSLRETWRSSGVALQEIVLEVNDTSDTIDTFAILNHNFTSDAVITLQGNTFNNFTSPPFSTTLAWNEKHMFYIGALPEAYQYLKIKVLDPGNPCGYVEIGKVVGGVSLVIENNEDITDDFSIMTDDLAYKMKTEGFFRASNETVKVDRLQVKFDKLNTSSGSDDNYQGLKTMVSYVGETIPFLTVLDPGDQYFHVIWGQLESMPSRTFTVNRYVSMSLSIQEMY